MSDLPTPEPVLDDALDIQHDPFPAEDHGRSRRMPHLGHAILFFAVAGLAIVTCALLLGALLHGRPATRGSSVGTLAVAAQGLGYLLTLVVAYWLFPLVWKRSFLDGIHWGGLVARRHAPRLIAAGVLLSAVAQSAERFVKQPTNPEIDQFMRTPAGAWTVMLMGTLLAPLLEEIGFRGFLLPAFATAYDWLSLERTPANVRRWAETTGNSQPALLFAALFSSLLFALVHAPQLDYAWGPVVLLFGVSLVLAFVRVRTHSVAASTLVHLSYNLTIFVLALIATRGFRHLDRL